MEKRERERERERERGRARLGEIILELTVVPTLLPTRRHTRWQCVVPKAITPRRKNSTSRLKTPILARKPYLTRPIWWPDDGERKLGSSVKNCPAPPFSWMFPATMTADQGVEGLGLEEGSFVVHLALVLPESGVGAERNQLRKSAR
ncbi:unnamed protein product [Prunus brigantina]